jgi:hypothetical protein
MEIIDRDVAHTGRTTRGHHDHDGLRGLADARTSE